MIGQAAAFLLGIAVGGILVSGYFLYWSMKEWR